MLTEISYFKVIIITSNNVRRKLESESLLEKKCLCLLQSKKENVSEKNTQGIMCIYISREIHEKVAIVTSRMGNGLSIGKFVDNILRDHFRQYGQQYMEQIENAQKVRL